MSFDGIGNEKNNNIYINISIMEHNGQCLLALLGLLGWKFQEAPPQYEPRVQVGRWRPIKNASATLIISSGNFSFFLNVARLSEDEGQNVIIQRLFKIIIRHGTGFMISSMNYKA